MTTTAPRAIWRRRSGSPPTSRGAVRVARPRATSGIEARRAGVSRVRRVAKTNSSTPAPQEQLETGAGVGLHGPGAAAGLDCRLMLRYHLGGGVPCLSPCQEREDPLAGHDRGGLVSHPSGADPSTDVGMLLNQLHVPPTRARWCSGPGRGLEGGCRRRGVAPAINPLVVRDVQRGALARLDVVSTPAPLWWWISTLPAGGADTGRRQPAPVPRDPDAMQSMHRGDGGVRAGRFRRRST